MSALPVLLGFDPSTTKLGWGVVRDDDGSPVTCGYTPLDGTPEAIARAVSGIARVLRGRGVEPVAGVVEYPFGGGQTGGHSIFQSGVAVGMCELAAKMAWPHLELERIGARSWRPKVGVPTPPKGMTADARRDWLKAADVERARELGFDVPIVGVRKRRPSDDAADGGLIARCCWELRELAAAA